MNPTNTFVFTGLDGTNPLGFLAALGALQAVGSGGRLAWNNDLRPILTVPSPIVDAESLTTHIATSLTRAKTCLDGYPIDDNPAEVVKTTTQQFRRFAARATGDPLVSRFAAAFGCEAINDGSGDADITPTRISLANGNGGKKLLLQFRDMIAAATDAPLAGKSKKKAKEPQLASLAELVRESIFEWRSRDAADYYSFRWDPAELRRYAHMARKPEDDKYRPVPGANLLAVLGLTLLPSVPADNELKTTCLFMYESRELFAWPLWRSPMSSDMVVALLTQPGASSQRFAPDWSIHRGVFARYNVHRYTDPQKNAYFAQSTAI